MRIEQITAVVARVFAEIEVRTNCAVELFIGVVGPRMMPAYAVHPSWQPRHGYGSSDCGNVRADVSRIGLGRPLSALRLDQLALTAMKRQVTKPAFGKRG